MKCKFVRSSLGVGSLILLFAAMDTRPCGQPGSAIVPVPGLGGSALQVNALNAAGQLTGVSYTTNDAATHAFLFSGGSSMDLGVLDGLSSQGVAINSSGQVAGDSDAPNFEIHAFFYDGTSMIDLGSLGGGFSSAAALNDAGQVVGSSLDGDFNTKAFLYSGGSMIDLGDLGGSSSSAVAINNNGNVAGNAATGSGDFHAFFWTNGTMIDLGTLGGTFSSAFAMNAGDVIVGESALANSAIHGFVYSGGVMTDVGTLGGSFSSAHAVNNAGDVIGNSSTALNEFHGFFYSAGTIVDLGTLGGSDSTAFALNNLGQVVGESYDSDENQRAFIWQNGTMVDLNLFLPTNSGWVLNSARLINDAGRVVGLGMFYTNSAVFMMDLGSDNNPPVAVAGADQLVECGSQVTLDGSQSNDPDNDLLSFVWKEGDTVLGTNAIIATSLAVGTHLITLTVTDPCEASAQDSLVVQVVDSTNPEIVGSPAVGPFSADAQCQGAVPDVVPGIIANDNCTPTGLLVITQDPAPGTIVGLGTHTIVVTVTDASSNSTSGSLQFSVIDTTAPTVVSAPSSVTVFADHACQGAVPNVVPDIVATDNCTAAAALTIQQSPAPGTLLGTGPHTITVTITDAAGNSATQQVTLLVKDNAAPVTNSLSVSPNVLSPPNHTTIPVTVSVSATDNCDPNPVCKIISITSSEPADPADMVITGDLTADLVATRNPSGGGRVYTITVECSDNSGNSTTGTVTVTVPKGNSSGGGRP